MADSALRGRRSVASGVDWHRVWPFIGSALLWLALVAGALWFIMPLLWMASSSLKTPGQIFRFPPTIVPWPPQFRNYPQLFKELPFLQYFRNTLIITVPSVIGQVISSSFAAYGFSRVRWPGRNIVFVVVLATLMLPFTVTMIPLYIMFRQLGWVGTFAPLIVPNFFTSAFDIFLFRQFFLGLPGELTDAARVDGASHFRIYWQMIIPLSKPVFATVAIFEFLYNWNDFLGPLIYLQNNNQYTMSLALNDFQARTNPEPHLLMVASTLMIVPIVLVFIFCQRFYIRGVALTGIKG